jgi:hypothetical protein
MRGVKLAVTSKGFEAFVTIVDTGGDQSTLSFQLVAPDMVDALVAMTAILSRLAAVTSATVKSYFVGERYSEDALVLPADAQVEERATIVCNLAGDPLKKTTINITATEDAMFGAAQTTAYNDVDIANAALSTYLSIWQSGGFATISDGELLAAQAAASGKRTHRHSSRG